jgi:hypothetical protein
MLAVVIGTLDVTSVTDVNGTRVRYRPMGGALPGGETPITIYVVRDKKWNEVAKFAIKVRNRLGLDEGRVLPTIDLSSAGELKRGGTDTTSYDGAIQDATLRLGVESTLNRAPWGFLMQANALGVSKETDRLRFESMQGDAPVVDLTTIALNCADSRPCMWQRVGLRPSALARPPRGVGGALQPGRMASVEVRHEWQQPGRLDQPPASSNRRIGVQRPVNLELLPSCPAPSRRRHRTRWRRVPIATSIKACHRRGQSSGGAPTGTQFTDRAIRLRRRCLRSSPIPLIAFGRRFVHVAVRPTTRNARFAKSARNCAGLHGA